MKLLLTGRDGSVGSVFKRHGPCIPPADKGGAVDLGDTERLRRAVARVAADVVMCLQLRSCVVRARTMIELG